MWNSQTVLLALIRKGLTREDAYALVQRNAMKTWEVKHAGRDDADFLEILKADPEVARHFKSGELEALCSLDFHLKEVDNRFQVLGLGPVSQAKTPAKKPASKKVSKKTR
jgi:adenylosuccinate lyase